RRGEIHRHGPARRRDELAALLLPGRDGARNHRAWRRRHLTGSVADQAGGPLVRTTLVVCVWPEVSAYWMVTVWPGLKLLTRAVCSDDCDVTAWPPTLVMMSPGARPEPAAGPPETRPEI